MTEWGNVIGTFLALLFMLVVLPWLHQKIYQLITGRPYQNNTTDIISNGNVKRKV